MYKVASAGHQRVLSRGKLADWQHGTERSFTPEEELRDVRTQNGQLNVIFNMMDKSDPRYAQMKVKLDALRDRTVELRAQLGIKGKPQFRRDFANFIADVAKENMLPFQWTLVMKGAKVRYDRMLADIEAAEQTEH